MQFSMKVFHTQVSSEDNLHDVIISTADHQSCLENDLPSFALARPLLGWGNQSPLGLCHNSHIEVGLGGSVAIIKAGAECLVFPPCSAFFAFFFA